VVQKFDDWLTGNLLILALFVMAIFGTLFILYILWMLSSLLNSDQPPRSLKSWVIHNFSPSSKKIRVFLFNMFYHFVILGFTIKVLFFPDKPEIQHWLSIVIMVMFMSPIAAYFYGWDMRFKAIIPANAPKHERLFALIIMLIGYSLIFLLWLGVIDGYSK
jgi:hypothetical protein